MGRDDEMDSGHLLAPAVSHECRLRRIEVHAEPNPEDNEQRLSWAVYRTEEIELSGDHRFVVVTAHIYQAAEEWWAQSLVVGQVVINRAKLDEERFSTDDLVSGSIEEFYDVGRREILALAQKMDIEGAVIPRSSPRVPIEILGPLSEVDGSTES